MTRPDCILGLLLAALLLGGCAPGNGADDETARVSLAFDTARARIVTESDTFPLRAEIARTPEQRAQGLMERTSLPEDAGMLFLYDEPQPPEGGFWMFRTRIPLDIAFLGPEGEIVAIEQMEPCTSPDPRWCPTYSPGVGYRGALEVNRGYFAARGIAPGARVQVETADGWVPAPRG